MQKAKRLDKSLQFPVALLHPTTKSSTLTLQTFLDQGLMLDKPRLKRYCAYSVPPEIRRYIGYSAQSDSIPRAHRLRFPVFRA